MSDPNPTYVFVNEKRVSIAAFLAMDKAEVLKLDARGCTGLGVA